MPFREDGLRLVRAEEMSKEASEFEVPFSSSDVKDEQDTPMSRSCAMAAARRFLDIDIPSENVVVRPYPLDLAGSTKITPLTKIK